VNGVAVEGAKERIMAAAVRLFCRKGFDAASVREICMDAGVTKPGLYYYFRNKEDLFHTILQETLQRFRENFQEACAGETTDFRSQLNAVAAVFIEAARAQPDLVRFINSIAFSGLYDELFDFHDYWMKNVKALEDLFATALDKGWVRSDLSPRALAFHFNGIVLSVMRGLVYFPQCVEGYPIDHIAELVLGGIGSEEAEG